MTDQGKLTRGHSLKPMLPSLATLGSLFLGVMAILFAGGQHFLTAAMLILAGTLLDAVDGQIAHRLNVTSNLGKQLDSLADMVTFGVAPTILLYYLMINMGVPPIVAVVASAVFALAGALRLARFNTQPSDRSAFFTGMPIPLASIFLIAGSFWQQWALNYWWVGIVVAVSLLMVSTVPYPKLQHLLALPWWMWLLAAGVCLAAGAAVSWRSVPFVFLLLYVVGGPLYALLLRRHAQAGGMPS